MGTEQLYFIIGFLLGAILSGCLCILGFIGWYEWSNRNKNEVEENK